MLKGVPKRWASYNYAVEDSAGRHIGDVELSQLRERGLIRLEGGELDVFREGGRRGAFILGSNPSLRALRPSAFRSGIEIYAGSQKLLLERKSPFRRDRILYEDGRILGSLGFEGFSRRVNIDLPEDLSLTLRLFVFWLALLSWKRDETAASA